MATFSPPPGTADIFPAESLKWRKLENTAEKLFSSYGYGELRTPVFEYTEIFQKGLGGDTEVVQKEMYTFLDRGGRSLTLRPEGTAGVMRALTSTDVMNGVEQRVYYYGPMFRGERPAAGRRRQFYQIGVENVGRVSPAIDAECIAMLMEYLSAVGINNVHLAINSRGVMSDRDDASNLLREYFANYVDDMCEDCKVRFKNNIWRILDCKQQECRKIIANIPDYRKSFSESSQAYFEEVKATLDALNIKYTVDPFLVRGLDYYVHTVFELSHELLGTQTAIAGGGRYELYLPGENRPVQGVGFAAGMERLLMLQDALKIDEENQIKTDFYFIGLNREARLKNLQNATSLRRMQYKVMLELEERSFKAQMRGANRSGAKFVLIRGESEIEKNIVIVKNMLNSEQSEIEDCQLENYLKEIIKNA